MGLRFCLHEVVAKNRDQFATFFFDKYRKYKNKKCFDKFCYTLANIHIHMIVCCVTVQCAVHIIENNLHVYSRNYNEHMPD